MSDSYGDSQHQGTDGGRGRNGVAVEKAVVDVVVAVAATVVVASASA